MRYLIGTLKSHWQQSGFSLALFMAAIRACVTLLHKKVLYRYLKLLVTETRASNDNHPILFCSDRELIPVKIALPQPARGTPRMHPKNHLHLLGAFLLAIILTPACSGTTGPGSAPTNPGEPGSGTGTGINVPTQGFTDEHGGGGTGSDDGDDKDDPFQDSGPDKGDGPDKDGPGDDGAMPPLSLPAPTLRKTLVADYDQDRYVPGIGYNGAIPEGQVGHDVIMWPQEPAIAGMRLLTDPKNQLAQNHPLQSSHRPLLALNSGQPVTINGHLASDIYAFEFPIDPKFIDQQFIKVFEPDKPAASEPTPFDTLIKDGPDVFAKVLDEQGVEIDQVPVNLGKAVRCEINPTTRGFVCYNNQITDETLIPTTPYCFGITDGTNLINFQDPTQCQRPNKFVKWLAQTPLDVDRNTAIAAKPGTFLTQASRLDLENTLVQLQRDGTELRVEGKFDQNYAKYEMSGVELAVEGALYSTRLPLPNEGGPGVFNKNTAAPLVVDSSRLVTMASEYTKIKRTSDEKIRFGVEYEEPETVQTAYIYLSEETQNDDIVFFDNTNDSLQPKPKRTLSFDVDNEYAIVVYVGSDGFTYLRSVDYLAEKRSTPVKIADGPVEIKEMSHYAGAPATKQAILLNETDKSLGIVGYATNVESNPPTFQSVSIPGIQDPQGMTLSPDQHMVYVVDQGTGAKDEALYQVQLHQDGQWLTAGQITNGPFIKKLPLRPYLEQPGPKDFAMTPDQVVFDQTNTKNPTDDHLILTARDLKSALVIPVKDFEAQPGLSQAPFDPAAFQFDLLPNFKPQGFDFGQ